MVRAIHAYRGIKIGDVGGGVASIESEAVVIDLGSRGVLFALIGDDYGHNAFFRAFPSNFGGLTKEGMRYYSQLKNAKASLYSINYLPRFVSFHDRDDPKTARSVDVSHLDQSFGQGIKIKDIKGVSARWG